MKIYSNFIDSNDKFYEDLKSLNKPITFFYDYIPKSQEELNYNPYNFIMLHEPNEFFGMHDWVINNSHLFSGILTWNQKIIDNCDNAICFHHSANHFDPSYTDKFKDEVNKNFEVSYLAGVKDLVEGHKLRQDIYKVEDKINIPKKWFYVMGDFDWEKYKKEGNGRPDQHIAAIAKQKLYDESMFSIVVENVNYNNWYTEKISDCFNTKTIPLYWGCPNISDWGYNEKGIIRFNSIDELIKITNNLTKEMYDSMKPYINHNYKVAQSEIKSKDKLEMFFKEIIKINDI